MTTVRLTALCALVPALLAVAGSTWSADAPPVGVTASEEVQQVDDRQVKVWAKKEVTITPKFGDDEDDVQTRELWSSSFDGKTWSDWQKHGLAFAKRQAVTWSPSEGHWRIYLRKIKVSGAAMPVPTAETKALTEFIIDRTAPTAAIAFPASKAKLRGGQKYTIKWDASDPYLKAAPVTLRWSRDGKGAFDAIAENLPNTGSYEWTVPKDMTTAGQLQILVADKAGNVGLADSTSVLVDSVNPNGKVLAPAISAKPEVALDVQVADVGPAGMSAARLWVSQDDGTSWSEGPFIQEPFKSVAWKATVDGKFRLAIVATDQAGNSNPAPKGKADDQFLLTVDTIAPTINLVSAIGIVEAEKASGNRRAFKAGDRVAVAFTIKDANLAPNSVTVSIQTNAAKGWKDLAKGLPTDQAYRFEIPAEETKAAKVRITAVDLAGNVGSVESGETFQIDTKVEADTDVEIK
jgi:hypothetical protein